MWTGIDKGSQLQLDLLLKGKIASHLQPKVTACMPKC